MALGDRVLLTVLFWVPFWVLFWVLFGANHAKYKAFPSKPNMLSGVMLFFLVAVDQLETQWNQSIAQLLPTFSGLANWMPLGRQD